MCATAGRLSKGKGAIRRPRSLSGVAPQGKALCFMMQLQQAVGQHQPNAPPLGFLQKFIGNLSKLDLPFDLLLPVRFLLIMLSTLAIATVLGSAAAFVPASTFSGSQLASRAGASSSMTMAASGLVGASAPLGFFDPLGFSKNSPEVVASYRESELKHGRAAMLAVLGVLTQEIFHPLYPTYSTNPLKAATELSLEGWAQIVAFCGVIEFVASKIKQRPGYMPGDLLGASELMDQSDDLWVMYQTKELNNGRAAMLGIMGILAQASVDGLGPLEHIRQAGGFP